jgi:hypothetical protein
MESNRFHPVALRYYPSAPINERAAIRDTVLPLGGGPDGTAPVHVRKGQSVFYHTWAMHRSTDLWGPDAGVFRPERWEEWNGRSGWRFTPFGGGLRICPGREFTSLSLSSSFSSPYTMIKVVLMGIIAKIEELARTETMFFVTRILQTFSKLENRDDKPFKESVGVVFTVPAVMVSLRR